MSAGPKFPTTTTARVVVTLEIEAGSSWSAETTNQQVYDQAKRETVQALQNWIATSRVAGSLQHRVRIVGEAKVILVMHGERE